jgi:hypothetical protein
MSRRASKFAHQRRTSFDVAAPTNLPPRKARTSPVQEPNAVNPNLASE